jgi:hypothetical protein
VTPTTPPEGHLMTTSADTHDDGVVRDEGLLSEGMSRRQALARIGVGGAVIWASPVLSNVALAGPTSCHPVQLNWDSYAVNSVFTSATLAGCTISFTQQFYGGSSSTTSTSGPDWRVIAGPRGGISGNFWHLNQNAVTNGGRRMTITFSYPVYNVSFTITDIDNQNNSWSDRVVFTPVPTSNSKPYTNGTRVLGNGAATGNTNTTGPFRNNAADDNLDDSSNRGNVTVSWTGPITSIVLDFYCSAEEGSNQRICIGDINFCV